REEGRVRVVLLMVAVRGINVFVEEVGEEGRRGGHVGCKVLKRGGCLAESAAEDEDAV
nr:hypothetical protein [Tanacetum cinerariifolium]